MPDRYNKYTGRDNFFLTVENSMGYGARMVKELSTSEVAGRLGVSAITVRLWCRRRLFKNARELPTPRGPVWVIPITDLEGFKAPTLGRPKKSSAPAANEPEEKAA